VDSTHELIIDQPIDDVWPALVDLRRVAASLPGAELEDEASDGWFDGLFKIKLGAFNAAFRGQARYRSVDEAAHRFVLEGTGGSPHGDATLTVTGEASSETAGTTRVRLTSSIDLTGRLAQFGASMADNVLAQLMDTFARNLAQSFDQDAAPSAAAPASTATPSAGANARAAASADVFDVGGSLGFSLSSALPILAAAVAGTIAGALMARMGRKPRELHILVRLTPERT